MPRYSEFLKPEPRALARIIPRAVPPALRLPPEVRRDLLQREGVEGLTRELYALLRDQSITWEGASPDPSVAAGSHIRTIDATLIEKRGASLDLALLFCAVCLAHDLAPLLIVLEGHAFVAVSTERASHQPADEGEPAFTQGMLTDLATLRNRVARGLYLPVESTGFAIGASPERDRPEGRGREWRSGCMSFERAVQAGREQLDACVQHGNAASSPVQRAFRYALDIVTLQNRYGFTPVDDPGDSRVYLCSAHAEGGGDASVRNEGPGDEPSALPDADRVYDRSAHAEGGGNARVENRGASSAPSSTGARRTYVGSAHAEDGGTATVVNEPQRTPAAPLIVLAAYAAPRGVAALAWEIEERALRDCLAPYPERLRFEPLPRATPDDLHRALLRLQPALLHILSHGDQGDLLFEDSSGDAHPLPRAALLQTIASTPSLRCVILSACESAAGLTALGPGMPPVIAMRAAISSEAARAFAQGFYDAIAAGHAVRAAYAAGCNRMRLTGAGGADVPVLLA